MIALTSPLVWYSTRATGTVALVLLTAAMVLGILTAVRAGSTALPRFAVSDLHRRVSLVAGIFVLLHVATAVVDTFVPLGWPSLVVPFTSHYRPFWVGTGTIAFDLLVAVTATSLLRRRIGARLWRVVHWAVYACWPVAVAHGIGTGTDLRFGWMQILVGTCCASVLAAAVARVAVDPHRPGPEAGADPARLVGSYRAAGRSIADGSRR